MMTIRTRSTTSLLLTSFLGVLFCTLIFWFIIALSEANVFSLEAIFNHFISPNPDTLLIRLAFPVLAVLLSAAVLSQFLRHTADDNQRLKQQQKLSSLIKGSTDITLIIDPLGVCRYASPSIKHILGYESGEIEGKALNAILNPSQISRAQQAFTLALNEQSVALPVSLQVIDKRGTIHHLEGTIANMLKVPSVEGLIVNLRDITAQVFAENKRDQIQSKYQNLFFKNQVAIWEEDYSGVFQELHKLKEMGIDSITDYFNRNEGEVERLAAMVSINEINHATLTLFNASSRNDFIDHINEITNHQTLDVFAAQVEAIWKGENQFQADATYQTLDGNTIHVHLYMPIPEHVADYDHIPISRQNITDRKNAEKALQRSQHQLAEAQRLAKIGSWEWSVADQNITCSKEAYRILGYEVPPLTIHKDEFIGRIHPDDRVHVKEAINSAIEHIGRIDLEYRVLTPDGHCHTVNAIAEAIFESDGQVSHMVGTLQDVTKQRQSEERMALANRMFQHTHVGVFITDHASRIININKAFTTITGYTFEEAFGQTPKILQSGNHTDQFYQDMWSDIKKNGHWQGEIWNRTKDGQLYSEWLMINEVKDQKTNTLNYIGTFSDVHPVKESVPASLKGL